MWIELSTDIERNFSLVEFGVHLPNNHFRRGIMITLDKLPKLRAEYHNTGIYTTLYKYNNAVIDEAELYGPFYLDFDADIWDVDAETARINLKHIQEDFQLALTYFEVIYGIPRKYAQSYYSGKKGFHLVYPAEIFDVEPRKDLNRIYKLMRDDVAEYAKHDTIDKRIYDNKRLFRVNNSKHQDTGLYKVPLPPEFLLKATLDDLKNAARTPIAYTWAVPVALHSARRQYRALIDKYDYQQKELERKRQKVREKPLDYTPPCIELILENGVEEGARNNTMAALVSFFKQTGMSEEEAFERTMEWGRTKCTPPIPKREIEATVPSIYSGEKRYGCSALRELSTCYPAKCKLYTAS